VCQTMLRSHAPFCCAVCCCCSAIVTADKALLFEPASTNTRKLLDTLVPRLQVCCVTCHLHGKGC
jgi:hypothetical protein